MKLPRTRWLILALWLGLAVTASAQAESRYPELRPGRVDTLLALPTGATSRFIVSTQRDSGGPEIRAVAGSLASTGAWWRRNPMEGREFWALVYLVQALDACREETR